jgi:uncharacterized protein with von Willebrand factor type A (vWA) domain
MFDRFRGRKSFRYSRWDGTQRLDDLDAEDVLDALSDDYLKHGDLRRALERLMQQGFTGRDGMPRMGLQDLINRLRQQRQQRLDRYNMSGVMDDILEKLEHVKELEREGIQRRLDGQQPSQGEQRSPSDGAPADGAADETSQSDAPRGAKSQAGERGQTDERGQTGQAGQRGPQGQPGQSSQRGAAGAQGQSGQSGQPRQPGQADQQGVPDGMDPEVLRRMLENIANRKLEFLDQLPPDPAGQIRQLTDYDFMDEQARQEFQELLAMLQQQIMQQYFQGMQQALQNMTPEDLARMRQMVRDLNQMLRERAEGGEPDFDSFMQQYGDFFGPGINTLDDLVERLQQQQLAMQAVMDSMSAEQREQLRDMIDQLIGDDRLRVDLAELAMNLDMLAPSEGTRTKFRLTGDEPVSLQEAMHLMGTLQEMDALEQEMQQARRSGDIDSLDAEKLRDLVGAEEAQALEELQQLLKQLEEEGLIRRDGDRYEMTARGIRRIGQKALEDIFTQLKRDAFGQHRLAERGYGGERSDDTKPYVFGDPFHLHLEQTLRNALSHEGKGTPIQLHQDDFEVYRTEQLTQSATVVMLDMSFSMLQNDLWMPAKKVAIALESLIRGQFPRDQLHLVGFSNLAREYQPEELVELNEWDNIQGTNMVHGLMVARQLLARSRSANKQILMITDGGPTMWLEFGRWRFHWPPEQAAELQTLREVRRCQREGIVVNVFMLSDEPYLKHFVNQMATVNRGRAFYVHPDNLGEYLLIDYLSHKQKHVS